MKKKLIAVLCTAVFILPMLCVSAEYKEDDLKEAIDDAIEWKEDNDSPFYGIGTDSSDLYIMALRRMGKSYDYTAYLSGLDGIAAGYGAEHKASDMQRTAIATLAAGGEPRNVGGRDMIADSTYYRDNVSPVGKEGADGFSWALIALDSNNYQTPEWALKNRNDIIVGILSHQNENGSFDDSVYSTASAITALAPYYDTSGAYTITQNQTGWTLDLSPKTAVDNAIEYLSNEQTKNGDWGDVKSTAMTIIALNTMGIDADDDDRFTAKKGTAIDGLMSYQKKNGRFSDDSDNSDGTSTSFALCALTSQLRSMQGKSAFFTFSVNDAVEFETPAPATSKPSAGSGNTSSSSAATAKPRATVKPSSTSAPKATSRPASTLQPKKTTAPKASTTPKPTSTPKATKRPALVGPVEMPGPMPSVTPTESPLNGNSQEAEKNNSPIPVIVVSIIAVLALACAVFLWYLHISGKMPDCLTGIFTSKKSKADKEYKAKSHKRTDIRRKFNEREKYRKRKKYNKRNKR